MWNRDFETTDDFTTLSAMIRIYNITWRLLNMIHEQNKKDTELLSYYKNTCDLWFSTDCFTWNYDKPLEQIYQ